MQGYVEKIFKNIFFSRGNLLYLPYTKPPHNEKSSSIFSHRFPLFTPYHLLALLWLASFSIASFRIPLIRNPHRDFSFLSSSRNFPSHRKTLGITFFLLEELLYFSLTLIIKHMRQFKNIFHFITRNTPMNFHLVVQIRRCKMEQEGHFTDNINWEHYARVLEAKQRMLPE